MTNNKGSSSDMGQLSRICPDLLPCPFCGGKAASFTTDHGAVVHCDNDECHVFANVEESLIEEAIGAWNQRYAAASENRTQESRWISTAERQPDKDGRLWAVLTESRRDGLVVGYIPMFEYYHFIDGWATDEPVRFWFEAELHPLPKVQK